MEKSKQHRYLCPWHRTTQAPVSISAIVLGKLLSLDIKLVYALPSELFNFLAQQQ